MDNCEHDYKILDVVYSAKPISLNRFKFLRITTFYCTKCLEHKEIVKEENTDLSPEWYKKVEFASAK